MNVHFVNLQGIAVLGIDDEPPIPEIHIRFSSGQSCTSEVSSNIALTP